LTVDTSLRVEEVFEKEMGRELERELLDGVLGVLRRSEGYR
jgi:hypothetical protein